MKQGNLTFEFELVSAAYDVCYKDTGFQESGDVGDGITNFNQNNAIDGQITDVQVKASVCTLNNQLQNSIQKHWDDGGALSIN